MIEMMDITMHVLGGYLLVAFTLISIDALSAALGR